MVVQAILWIKHLIINFEIVKTIKEIGGSYIFRVARFQLIEYTYSIPEKSVISF